MEALLSSLLKVLEAECRLHEELRQVAGSMNKALREHGVEEVQKASAHYDRCSCEVEKLEEERLSICDGIARTLKSPSRHITLDRIVGFLPEDRRRPLLDVRDRLRGLVMDLTSLNTSNAILLDEGLRNVAKTFEILTHYENKYAGYLKRGQKDTKPMTRTVFSRIA